MKRALISGITGQTGSYLAELLLSFGYEVHGLVRRLSMQGPTRLDGITGLILHEGDMADQYSLQRALEEAHPDEVYNLAAQSFVPLSWRAPVATADITGIGTLRLLEAVRTVCPEAKFYQAGSSEMFGKVRETPQRETTPFYPRSPYGVAKCVTARTLIYTANGRRRADRVKVGDMIWTHTGQLRRVSEVFTRETAEELLEIRAVSSSGHTPEGVQSNFQLRVTREHPIWTQRGWIAAWQLRSTDKVAVVAATCCCGSKMPANRLFCSQRCATTFNNRKPERKTKQAILSKLRMELYGNPFLSLNAIRRRRAAQAALLRARGKNTQETYLDLLIQDAAPGFFKFTGDGRVQLAGYCPDWYNEEKRAVIEYVGWGSGIPQREAAFSKKLAFYNENGFRHLVLRSTDYNAPEDTRRKVAAFCANLGSVEYIFVPIKSVRSVPGKQRTVYNFEVDTDHSFVANGIVVHNCFAHYAVVNYRESYGMFAVNGIAFNHESPRRSPDFVTRKVTLAAARIARGLQDSLTLGNLDAKRDWGHAKDYARAMWMMLQHHEPADFVIATGVAHSVRNLCQAAFSCVGLNWEKYVREDGALRRPAEVDSLIGDPMKIRHELCWRPEYNFEALIDEMTAFDFDEPRGSQLRASIL